MGDKVWARPEMDLPRWKEFFTAAARFRFPQSIPCQSHRCSLPGLAGSSLAKNLRGQKFIAGRDGFFQCNKPLSGLQPQHEADFW